MNEYILSKYKFIFGDVKHEKYNCEDYFGIKFFLNNEEYDCLYNVYLGFRLIVKNNDYFKDMPLNSNTIKFIPSEIKIMELEWMMK